MSSAWFPTYLNDISHQLIIVKNLKDIAANSNNFEDIWKSIERHPLYDAINRLAHPLVVKCIYDICQVPGNSLRVPVHELQFFLKWKYTYYIHISQWFVDGINQDARKIEEYANILGIKYEKCKY
jgi:hypothetical protein